MDIAGWEERYRSGATGDDEAPTRLLVDTSAQLTPGTALDLACGAGRHAIYLAKHGWNVAAIDASPTAIHLLEQRASAAGLKINTKVSDLAQPHFTLPPESFDLILIAYYLQRDLFEKVKAATHSGGIVIAIAHTPQPGESPTLKRAAHGELQTFFHGWDLLWQYEGPSRDPAHRHPVAEIVARLQR